MSYVKCQYSIQFLWRTDWVHNQNMCLLDWVGRLHRKYKLPFSFHAATPCIINKFLSKYRSVHGVLPLHSIEISRVGNLMIMEWSLKYIACKSISCFISKNTKSTSYLWRKSNQNFKLLVGNFCRIL